MIEAPSRTAEPIPASDFRAEMGLEISTVGTTERYHSDSLGAAFHRTGFEGSVSKKVVPPRRRLRGFLISMESDFARVAFVDDSKSITEYRLPARQLRTAHITEANQPFEMDEIEQEIDGGMLVGYLFRPMAPASSCLTDYLNEDQELVRLRDAAIRHFGQYAL